MDVAWWISLVSGVLGIGVPAGSLLGWSWARLRDRRELARRLAILRTAATEGEIALCVGIGGSGQPEPDVLSHLRRGGDSIPRVVVYQAPANVPLDDPEVALRVVEDLTEFVRQLGSGEMTRIHLFPAGMIAYPFVIGALLSNLCPVVVYHRKKAGDYVPLYEWNRDDAHRPHRLSRPLSGWRLESVPASTRTEVGP